VSAPTGSGKTLIADYIVNRDLQKGLQVVYTAPIKALSNQKYKEFSADYGGENVGLLTGDVVRNPAAPILIMTTEIYRNMVLTNDIAIQDVSYVIFDEIHYINDIERGTIWEESIIFSPGHIRMLCLSATIPNADEFASWIAHIKGHEVSVVRHHERPVPLHTSFFDAELGITTLKKIKDIIDIPDYDHVVGRRRQRRPPTKKPSHIDLVRMIKNDKLPCLFFTLSRVKCQQNARELATKKWFEQNPEIATRVRQKLQTAPSEINTLESAQTLRAVLPYGIAFHHAGMLPVLKELVEELFGDGLIKVLYTTETFGVGINMPAKTACLESLRKFDGLGFRLMNSKEFFQMAGRAGRRGLDTEGYVYVMLDRRDFDFGKIKKLTTSDTDPIKSQFKLSVNTVLNLIAQHETDEIAEILGKNFDVYQKQGKRKSKTTSHFIFDRTKSRLEKMGYVTGNALTAKGEFAAKIYADELLIGELFATEFHHQLTSYQALLLVGALCYEGRERTQFRNLQRTKESDKLTRMLMRNAYARRFKRFNDLEKLTALIKPCFDGGSIFDIVQNTTLLEGDIIRMLRQMLDRMRQIEDATHDNVLKGHLADAKKRILSCLKDVDVL
jgi:superfamily II RNA helicase